MEAGADVVQGGFGVEEFAHRIPVFGFGVLIGGNAEQAVGFGLDFVVSNLNMLYFGEFAKDEAGDEAALGAGSEFGLVFIIGFAHKLEVGGQIQALLLEHSFPVGLEGFQLALVEDGRGVDGGGVAEGVQAFLFQFLAGGGFGVFGKRRYHIGAQGGEVVVGVIQGTGEVVVQVREDFFLDGEDGYGEVDFLAGVAGAGVVLGDGEDEVQVVLLGDAKKVGGEAGEGQDIVVLGNVFHILLGDDGFVVHSAVDGDVEAVAELGRSFYGFPDRLLFLHLAEDVFHALVGDGYRFVFHPEGLVVAEFHGGFQGDGGGEGNGGFQFGNLDPGVGEGGDFGVGEDLVEGFGHHIIDGFLEKGSAPDHSFHDMAGGAAAAEAGDVDAAHGAAVGAFQERVFVLDLHFHRQRDLNG